jgi:uncharacterized protein YjbI with pentapeptide repeats/fumarate reductase subunit C
MVEEKGKQAEERQDEPRLWRPWRPPSRRMGWRVLWRGLWAVGMVVAVLTLTGLLIVDLRPEIWKGLLGLLEGRVLTLVALGFSLTAIIVLLAIGGAASSWTGFRGKTVWDFLQLLIVPLVLAVIGLWFATQQDARQQQFENQRSDAERKFADQRAQDEALQAYLDQMSQLLLDRKLLEAEQDTPLYTVAQARTSTLILRLDAEHNESVTRFLINSGLAVSGEASARLLREITLSHATLSGAYLPNADLSNADLSYADLRGADLSSAEVSGANLTRAHLFVAHLSKADLSDAGLHLAHLILADLSGANLSEAALRSANLRGADLRGANLRGANLRGADLSRADGRGATMPNGQKYTDWLKDREKRQQD